MVLRWFLEIIEWWFTLDIQNKSYPLVIYFWKKGTIFLFFRVILVSLESYDLSQCINGKTYRTFTINLYFSRLKISWMFYRNLDMYFRDLSLSFFENFQFISAWVIIIWTKKDPFKKIFCFFSSFICPSLIIFINLLHSDLYKTTMSLSCYELNGMIWTWTSMKSISKNYHLQVLDYIYLKGNHMIGKITLVFSYYQ